MTRTALALALLLLGAALASCSGKSNVGSSAATGAQASSTPSTGAQGGAPGTRAAALAFARAVNLRAADLPGFRPSAKREDRSPTSRRVEGELQRCLGTPHASETLAESGSGDFESARGLAQHDVSSSVTVARSAAIALRELAQVRSAHTSTCLKRYFRELFEGPGLRGGVLGPVSVQQGSPPAPGTSASVGLRVTTSITVRSVRIPYYLDILGFVYGPADVALFSSGLPVPMPAAIEQHLFLELLARARTRRP